MSASGELVNKFRIGTAMRTRTQEDHHNLLWCNLAQDEIGWDPCKDFLGPRMWQVGVESVVMTI